MSDSAAANGTRARTGYFSSLATDVFGRYAFDDGNWRFLTFLSQQRTAQLPTARDFSSAWTGLRAANLSGVGGPLTALTVDAGTWVASRRPTVHAPSCSAPSRSSSRSATAAVCTRT